MPRKSPAVEEASTIGGTARYEKNLKEPSPLKSIKLRAANQQKARYKYIIRHNTLNRLTDQRPLGVRSSLKVCS